MQTRWCCVLAGLALALPARAQFSIDWYTIGGGGGTSTGGVYSLSGTIGQPAAGSMAGGSYSLTGGFWGIIAAMPTAGAPSLTITVTATNTVLISWPSPSSGFVLEQNSDLNAVNWISAPQVPNDDGISKSIVVTPAAGRRFYRLKQ